MTHKNENPHESNSQPERPSVEEQEERLNELLAKNMRVIVSDSELFKKIMDAHKQVHPKMHESKPSGDIQVVIGRNEYGSRLEDGTWEEGEHIQVGFKQHFGDGKSSTLYAPVAKRVKSVDGDMIVPQGEFDYEQANKITEMVDELLLAKLSGQIPDLDEYGMSRIYVPQTSDYE